MADRARLRHGPGPGPGTEPSRARRRVAHAAVFVVPLLAVYLVGARMVRWTWFLEEELKWTALATLALCVLLAVQNGVVQARRARGARRREAGKEAAAELFARLGDDSSRAEMRRAATDLEPFHALSRELDPAGRARLRSALLEAGAGAALVERMRSRRKWKRVDAILLSGWLAPPEAVELLMEELAGDDVDVARAAARALAGYPDRAAYDALLRALAAGRMPRSRVAAVLELSQVRDPVPPLREASTHADAQVRFWVAYLLGRAGDPAAFPPLARLCRDPDDNVRANATEALGAFRDPGAIPLVAERLGDPVWFVRSHAAKAAGALRDPRLMDAVAELLRDPHWWVRQNAMLALERFGSMAVPRLEHALSDPDRFARNKAAEALGRVGAVAEQVSRLGGSAREARGASEFLLAVARAEGTRGLEDALVNAGPVARGRLLEVVAEVGDERSLPTLTALADDGPAEVRAGALEAARRIEARGRG